MGKKILLVCSILIGQFLFAQQKEVSGVVTDTDGLPLPGVNIVIQGTTTGTQTDFDGNYQITGEVGQTLVYSFIGFENHTLTIGEEDELNVALTQDDNALDEVVVTAFGRKVTRNESTSSVSSISAADLQKSPRPDPRDVLQGKVSGMVMSTPSGTPGTEPEIRIRGQNSITASNDPLYVIDGVPMNSRNLATETAGPSVIGIFSMLNPLDIENISVLKDASAVAPYGADGSNGVILITTKKGERGKARFALNSSIGIQNDAVHGPEVMNAQQRLEALQEGIWNTFGNGQFGNGNITSRDQINPYWDANISDHRAHWEAIGKPDFDWRNKVQNKNALLTNVNFSMSQADEKSNFYASVGYNKTEGTVVGVDMNRLTGSLNYGTKYFDDKLDFNISAHVGNVTQNGTLEMDTDQMSLANPNYAKYGTPTWVPAYNEDGSLHIDDFQKYAGPVYNPFYLAKYDIHRTDITRVLQNTQVEYHLLDNLSFKSVLGLDYTVYDHKDYLNPVHGGGQTVNGSDSEESQKSYSYTTQNSLNYNFQLNGVHNFQVTALQEFTKYKDHLLTGRGENFPSPKYHNISLTQSNWTASNTYSDQIKTRYVGLINYNFDLRYLLDLSYSYQGDSRFSKKYDGFYSIGAAWNIHEEKFLKDVDFVNRFRFKFGYGRTGNAGIGRNQYQELLGLGKYGGEGASVIQNYGTTATWERNDRFDVGIEFGLFRNRLEGSVGFYNNTTKDMLLQVPIPYGSGFVEGVVLRNNGEMRNRGFEIELGGYLVRNDDFQWRIDANLSTFSNRVTKMPEQGEITENTTATHQGHIVKEWYIPDWAGIDSENGLPTWYVDKTVSDEVTYTYSDAKRRYQGSNPLPTYNGMVATSLNYKNFFFEASFYYSGGNKIYEFKKNYFHGITGTNLLSFNVVESAYQGAWREPGDQATYPRFDYSNRQVADFTNDSTRWLWDDTFVRMRDIAVGYTVPSHITERLGLNHIGFSIRGKNLWTWVKDKGLKWDPETSFDVGYTDMKTPPVKSIVFNLDIKL